MTKEIWQPVGDRVLIKRFKGKEETAGGILIPDNAQEKPAEGKVLSVGEGARSEDGKIIPMTVAADDIVLFGKWSGTEIKIDGEDCVIVKASDIMAVRTKI